MEELEKLLFNTITIKDLNTDSDKIINEVSTSQQPKFILHNNELQTLLISIEEYLELTEKSQSKNVKNDENYIEYRKIESIKIGEIVKSSFEYLEKMDLLSEQLLEKLCSKGYSNKNFGLSYPLLKKVVKHKPIKEQILEGEAKKYSRYWSKVYNFNGEEYLICSQWYERHLKRFIQWFKSNLNINPYDILQGNKIT